MFPCLFDFLLSSQREYADIESVWTVDFAIVFVHGFTGDVAKTWRRIPKFLQADPRLNEWDLLGVGYQCNRRFDLTGLWSSDARLEEIAIMLHARPELSPGN